METYQPHEVLDNPEIPIEERLSLRNITMHIRDTRSLSGEELAALRRIDPNNYTHPAAQEYCRFLIIIGTGEPVPQPKS